jgi:hypothetical protein
MTILTSIILVVAVVAIAAFIAYNMQRGTKALSEFKADYDNNAEAQEVVELAKELYNKDLRPIVAKKAPKSKKPEFPIDQPAKKTKAVEQVETIAEVVTPEVVEAAKTVEAVLEPAKPKKKRKYYPRKPKTSI